MSEDLGSLQVYFRRCWLTIEQLKVCCRRLCGPCRVALDTFQKNLDPIWIGIDCIAVVFGYMLIGMRHMSDLRSIKSGMRHLTEDLRSLKFGIGHISVSTTEDLGSLQGGIGYIDLQRAVQP